MAFDPGDTSPSGSYFWRPGEGPDPEALGRLMRAFPRPAEPMGEAWFMAEDRRRYPELLGDLARLSFTDFDTPFQDIISGPVSFGHMDEWTDWFHYLAPRLVPRHHEAEVWASILELLACGFFSQHPHSDGPEPCEGFRIDMARTLGRCLMAPECWPNGRFDVLVGLDRRYEVLGEQWFWDNSRGRFSSSMFLCLKYLPATAVGPWMTSALQIKDARWRAHVMVWFIGAQDLLTGRVNQPGEMSSGDYPGVSWYWSHVLQGAYTGDHSGRFAAAIFLPEPNRVAALGAVRAHFTDAILDEWLTSVGASDDLRRGLGDLPLQFWDLCKA